MSDRRPEKLYKCEITPTHDEAYDPPEFFGNVISYPEASPADLLAAVRRGVESGEVEGEVVDSVSFAGVVGPDWEFHTSKPGRYLVVRLDDGECKHDWYRSVDAPPDTCLKCGAKENRG